MRLATFNVENLFDRPAVMNLPDWNDGKPILEDFARLNELIAHDQYTQKIKDELLKIMKRHKGLLTSEEGDTIILRERSMKKTQKLVTKDKNGVYHIGPNGRSDWVGWFELKEEPVDEKATENTARVIKEVKPDVLCVVEAEDRAALKDFNKEVIPEVGGRTFDHTMVIQGNDRRGINVGILARQPYSIAHMVSHVDDRDDKGQIFSRDCAEYSVTLPNGNGNRLLLLVNHFKSQSGGAETAEKRRRQAERVRAIYEQRLAEYPYIAIVGDLNSGPDSLELASLTSNGLVDIMEHEKFAGDGLPGTIGEAKKLGDKFDYILMSPELAAKVKSGGIERRGVWADNGNAFPHFPEINSEEQAASDHAALWVDLDL